MPDSHWWEFLQLHRWYKFLQLHRWYHMLLFMNHDKCKFSWRNLLTLAYSICIVGCVSYIITFTQFMTMTPMTRPTTVYQISWQMVVILPISMIDLWLNSCTWTFLAIFTRHSSCSLVYQWLWEAYYYR